MNRLLVAAILALLFCTPAHAYVDPGSGMLVWQGLLALVGGLIMLWREPVRTLKGWWGRLWRRH